MKTKLFALLVLCLAVSGCVSVPSPTEKENTLTIGKFIVNINTTGKMSGSNGTHKYGVVLYIENRDTGKKTSVYTQDGGWLMTSKLPEGNYVIKKMALKVEVRTGPRKGTFTWNLNGTYFLTVSGGVVNNIGSIEIEINNDYFHPRIVDFDAVQFDFETEFPDSEWNSFTWRNAAVFEN